MRSPSDDSPIAVARVDARRLVLELAEPLRSRDDAVEALYAFRVDPLRMWGAPRCPLRESPYLIGRRVADMSRKQLQAVIRLSNFGRLPADWSEARRAAITRYARARVAFETAWAGRRPQRYARVTVRGAHGRFGDPLAADRHWRALRDTLLPLRGQSISLAALREACDAAVASPQTAIPRPFLVVDNDLPSRRDGEAASLAEWMRRRE